MKLSKKINIALIGIMIPLFSYSCISYSVPEPKSEKSCLLVIKNNRIYKSPGKIVFDYRLELKDSSTHLYVNALNEYIVIKNLKPGNYMIYKLLTILKEDNTVTDQMDFNVKFELKPGKITILPAMINTILKRNTSTRELYQDWSTATMSKDEYAKIKMDLNEYENIELWEFDK